MARVLPRWCKEVKKAMIDKDMDTKDLAEKVGCTRQFICAVTNGRTKSPTIVFKISKILEIEKPEESEELIY